MYSKILIPVDGSDTSKTAAKKGVELASKFGSSVHAIYVIDPESFFRKIKTTDPIGMEKAWKNARLDFEKEGTLALNEVKILCKEKRVPFTEEILEGKPGVEIVNIAKDKNFDLIVMGSAKISNKFLLGSVAEHVVRNAHCSVLISK